MKAIDFNNLTDQAIDMIDFFGGELPTSISECQDYFTKREIDSKDQQQLFWTAQEIAKDSYQDIDLVL